MEQRRFARSICFGSIAWYLGNRSSATKTHKWCVYVRGPQNEDISFFIKSVEFHLHESFTDSVRVVSFPPFEVHETGWGEFEIKIVMNFLDPNEESVALVHMLRLHPDEPVKPATKVPICSEFVEEIEFSNPGPELIKALGENRLLTTEILPHPLLKKPDDTPDDDEIRLLKSALKSVKESTYDLKSQFDSASALAVKLHAELERGIAQQGRANDVNDEVQLWKPEDFRYAPVIEEPSTKKKVKKVYKKKNPGRRKKAKTLK